MAPRTYALTTLGAALVSAGTKLAGDDPVPPAAADPAPEALTAATPPEPARIAKARAAVLRRAYRAAKKRADAAEEALETAKAAIVEEMGSADELVIDETGRPFAELKTVESLIFEQARFREEHPIEASAYMKARTQRRFRLLA